MHDVVVVGGGPAGAAAAITCARAGLDVVVLERSHSAARKTGETLHPGVEPLLEQLGVADAVRSAGFLRHEGIEVAWGGAPRFDAYGADRGGPWRGFQAWRETFDALLLNAAERHGATVRRGVRVREAMWSDSIANARFATVQSDSGSLRARWIVDATGSVQWLGRRLGLQLERLSPRLICRFGYVRAPGGGSPRLHAHPGGWTWVAEVSPGLHQWTRLDFDGASARDVPIQGEPVGTCRASDVTWRWYPRCAGRGYYMVGDAAVVFDPSSSHGMLRAIMTGIYAGHLIAASERDRRVGAMARVRYRTWVGAWVAHDATALRHLYSRLPSPPSWVARETPPRARAALPDD